MDIYEPVSKIETDCFDSNSDSSIVENAINQISPYINIKTSLLVEDPPEGTLNTLWQYLDTVSIDSKRLSDNVHLYIPEIGYLEFDSIIGNIEDMEQIDPNEALARLFLIYAILNKEIPYFIGEPLNKDVLEKEKKDISEMVNTKIEKSTTFGKLIVDIYPSLEDGTEEIEEQINLAINNPEKFKKQFEGENKGTFTKYLLKRALHAVVISTILLSLMTTEIVADSNYKTSEVFPLTSETYLGQDDSSSLTIPLNVSSTSQIDIDNDVADKIKIDLRNYELRYLKRDLAKANYNFADERTSDPNLILNMKTSSSLINKYFIRNSIKPVNIESGMTLQEFMKSVTNGEQNINDFGFRYLEAMNFFRDKNIWVTPRQGIEGGGACDIATLIMRGIVQNYSQIGETEYWFGHKVERYGPFIVVFYEHTPYHNMPEGLIAVSSLNGSSNLLDYTNTEMFVFLVEDEKYPLNIKDVTINILEDENGFTVNFIASEEIKNDSIFINK